MVDYERLRYEKDGHVVTLTLNRPDQHNAIDRLMNRELHHAWQRFRDDGDAFVLVLTGAGDRVFSAGWDLRDASEMEELGDWDAFRRDIHNVPGFCGYTRGSSTSTSRSSPQSTDTPSLPASKRSCSQTSALRTNGRNLVLSSVDGT